MSISAGNSVTLTDTNTDSQTLTLAGQVLSISAGNSITLADTNTDTQTLSFISDVLTISGGNSVTIRSLPFTVSDGNTLAWNGTTNQWNAVNDLRVPVASAADPIQIFKSLIPANTTAELGRAANVFEKVFTKEIRSETASLVFNTGVSSLTAPQIVFEQGSTQLGGFGQNRFFIGNFAGGDYYIFPSTTTGANLNDVLTFNGSNALNFNSIATLEQQDLDDVVVLGGTTTRSISVGDFSADGDVNVAGGNINIATSLSNDTIELGNSSSDTLVIQATLSSTLEVVNATVDLGTNTQELGTVYTQNIDSNTSDLEFKRAGNTWAGIDTSNNFFIGQDSATGYTFPTTEPLSVDRQVLAYTASNTLSFLSIATTDSQTIAAALSGTTLELRPENITTASITVDLSSLAATPTLDQVTDVGSTTSNDIEVGKITATAGAELRGDDTVIGTSPGTSDNLFTHARLETTLAPRDDNDVDLGTANENFQDINTREVFSNSNLTLTASGTFIEVTTGGTTKEILLDNQNMFFGDAPTALTGSHNTAFGYNSLASLTGGYRNVAIGSSAAQNLEGSGGLNAGGNIAIGNQALYNSTEGWGNIAIGYQALDTPVGNSANRNTVVGYTADVNSTSIVNASAFGNGAIATASNMVQLGNSAVTLVQTSGTVSGSSLTTNKLLVPTSGDVQILDTFRPSSSGDKLLGTSSYVFSETYTKALKSGSSVMEIQTGASSGVTPALTFKESSTIVGGIALGTNFMGDISASTHYIFPATNGNINDIMVLTSTNALGFQSFSSLENQTLDDVVANNDTTTRTIRVGDTFISGELLTLGGNVGLGDSSTVEDIDIGGSADDTVSILGKINQSVLVSGTLDFGSTVDNIQNVYAQQLYSSGADLKLTSANDHVEFITNASSVKAGVTSLSFYVGNTAGNHYFFPQSQPGSINNQVLAYTASKTLTFRNLNEIPTGTSQGAVLRWNGSSWVETSDFRIAPGSGFSPSTAIWTNQSIIPRAAALNLGQSGDGFVEIYGDQLISSQNSITLGTNDGSELAYLKFQGDTHGSFVLNEKAGDAGGRNTALGYRTLNSTSSDGDNVAIGYDVLNGSSGAGSRNVGVGRSALALNSGSQNVAIGHQAAGNQTGGADNVALGAFSLQNNLTGEKNVALGTESLQDNTSDDNVAIGYQALLQNTSGNKNTALGTQALELNTTGSENVALGYIALNTNTTGSGNIAIGDGADVRNNNMTNAIAIGQDAEVRFSNSIQLGNSLVTTVTTAGVISATGFMDTSLGDKNEILVVGDNSRIVSTDLLTIDGTNKHVGIATSVPSVTLHMVGEATETSQIRMDQHNSDSDAPDIRFYKSRGSQSAPTAVANNDFLAAFNSFAYDGTSYVGAGNMRWYADGTDGDSYFRINTRVGGTDATRLEIDPSGDIDISNNLLVDGSLGIGTSVPTETFHIVGESDQATVIRFEQNNNGTDAPDIKFYKSRGTNASPSAVGSSDNLGFVNMFAHDGSDYVHSGAAGWTSTGTNGNSAYHIQTRVSGTRAQRFAIDSSGNTDIFGYLDVESNTAGNFVEFILSGTQRGSINVTTSATSYNTTSDYRLKEDFKDFNGLRLVKDLQVYDYRWKEEGSRSYGVKAHELQQVIPYSVTGEKDGEDMQMVDYSKLVPVLTKAIQEQQEQIETQQQQLESQADQIQALQQMVEQLIQAQQ